MSCVVCVVKPDSRGTIMAASSDPFARPAIKPNYLTTHTDELALLGGTRHLSAAQFVHEQRDALALVASQDGRFTVFAWSEGDGMVQGYRVEALLL